MRGRSPAARPDVYLILGAERSASWTELRRRYRARARELHPDVQLHRPGPSRLDAARATALFTQLQAAWQLVATPERRQAYDQARSASTLGQRRYAPPRPARPLRWPGGPKAGVLLRTGPGEFHIAVPGGAWDLSLSEFLERFRAAGSRPILIGDLPPHAGLRQRLREVDFIERHRLTTMVGWSHQDEFRPGDPEEQDEDGAWKLTHLGQALAHWSRSAPGRGGQLPYAAELLLMGRLSLLGYEINLPHPAGLFQAVEGHPSDRAEARRRARLPLFDLRRPPPALLLAATWASDPVAVAELGQPWEQLVKGLELAPEQLQALIRALDSRGRPRHDQEPLPGSALQRGMVPPALQVLLRRWQTTRAWLEQSGRLPASLPWGDPLSGSGTDHSLAAAAARLAARWLSGLLADPPPGASLVALNGARLRFRLDPDRGGGEATTEALSRASWEDLRSALRG